MADNMNEKLMNKELFNDSIGSLQLIFGDEIIETAPVSKQELLSIDSIGNWTGRRPLPKEVLYCSPFPSRGNPMLIDGQYVTMFQIDNEIEKIMATYIGG